MIFLAALTEGELTNEDFFRYVGSNPVHGSVFFNGDIQLAGQRVPDGHMKRYIWRMRDESVTSADIAIVVIFNQTRELRSFAQHQFEYERRLPEIVDYVDSLKAATFADSVDCMETTEGNLVYILRNCATHILSEAFSVHSRATIRKV